MGLFKGGALRLVQTTLYFILFCCSAVILGIFAYFLAVLNVRDETIPAWEKAVTGISGGAVLYSLVAVVLTCCLAGITIFGIIGMLMDVLFIGGMIAIAWFTRHGARTCRGYVITPLGSGPTALDDTNANNIVNSVGYRDACILNKVSFSVSIAAIFFFLVTALMQLVLMKQHKKSKAEKTSRAHGYDHGYATEKKPKFWQRKQKTTTPTQPAYNNATTGTAVGAGLAVPAPRNARASRDTNYTASTLGNNDAAYLDKAEKGDYLPEDSRAPLPNSAYGNTTAPVAGTHHHRAPSHGEHTHAPFHNTVHPHTHGEQPYQYAPTTTIPQIGTRTTTNTNTNTRTY